MATIFCVRPATRNIGNDVIALATAELLRASFGPDLCLINVPARPVDGIGGLTARQVYDINRLGDGVVVGGGNLLENGQIALDLQALEALDVPLMLIGVSYGRIMGRRGEWIRRTDSLGDEATRRLARKAAVVLARDAATMDRLSALGVEHAELAGCQTLCLEQARPGGVRDDRILLSIRDPDRMNVPPVSRARVIGDVRRMIDGLCETFGSAVTLVCHDYADLEMASAFPQVPRVYYEDAREFMGDLRQCRLNVTYRLHAFLPCIAVGSPSIHISYDERGADMLATIGMADWNVDMLRDPDPVLTVFNRCDNLATFDRLLAMGLPVRDGLRQVTRRGVERFAQLVNTRIAEEGERLPALDVKLP